MINRLKHIFLVLLFCSCTKNISSLDYYSNCPIKYTKTRVTHPTNDFSITIPKNWKWKAEKYEDEQIIIGMDIGETDSITKFTNIISIQKYKSLEKNLKLLDEFNSIEKNIKKSSMMPRIIESGNTNNLKYDAYYFHQRLSGNNPIEMISFIVKSKEKGIFYSLTASCQNTYIDDKNLSMMIKSIESFEMN